MVFTAIFTGLMALLAVQLYQSLRSRVEFGDTAVRITLPQGSGATPMLRFFNKEIPYDQIEAVETRRVLFGNALAPVLLRATRLRTKDGQHVRLGNVYEDNVDQAMPCPEIGAKLAERANCQVIDGGTVRRSIERRVLGLLGRKTAIEESPPLSGDRDRRAQQPSRARHEVPVVVIMAVLVVGGIAIDVFTAPRTSFATVGASAPRPRSSRVLNWRRR